MQDFCFHAITQDNVLVYLQSLGLAASDKDGAIRPLIEYACHDKVVETPGEYIYDGTEMVVVKEPVVLPGGYVVCRATDEQAALIEATPLPDGVELVAPPVGLPLFGGQWLMPDLAAARRAATDAIDNHAETLRLSVITPGAGQMAAYLRKEQQARAFKVATIPTDPEELEAFRKTFSAIYAEVGITADTPEEVADIVVANAEAWYAFGDAVEPVRLAGKQAVEAAGSKAAINAAVAAIVWPTP